MNIEQVWPEWQVDRLIGKGSYGAVYRCMKAGDKGKEYAAVKVISVPQDDFEADSVGSEGMTGEQSREYYKDITDNFINEIKILEALKDEKHIVNIQDSKVVEKEDGIGWQIFIRMELLTDFNTYASDKTFTPDAVRRLALDLCDALIVCGKKRIVHRDIKPENIFVDAEGNYKLGDFGVAKQLEKTYASMSTKGTYNYMAPEVVASKKYDSRADIYSLGMVMYKLLNNNRLPFLDPDKKLIRFSERQEAFERRIKGEKIPPIPGVETGLNDIILKACEFKPEDRYRTVEEFKQELSKEKSDNRFIRSIRKHKVTSYIALLLVLTVISGSVGFVHYDNKTKKIVRPPKTFAVSSRESGCYFASLNGIGIVADSTGLKAIYEEENKVEHLSDRNVCDFVFDGKTVCYAIIDTEQMEEVEGGENSVYLSEDVKYCMMILDINTKKESLLFSSEQSLVPVYFDDSNLYYFDDVDGSDQREFYSYSFEKKEKTNLNRIISNNDEYHDSWNSIDFEWSLEQVNNSFILAISFSGDCFVINLSNVEEEYVPVHSWGDLVCVDEEYLYFYEEDDDDRPYNYIKRYRYNDPSRYDDYWGYYRDEGEVIQVFYRKDLYSISYKGERAFDILDYTSLSFPDAPQTSKNLIPVGRKSFANEDSIVHDYEVVYDIYTRTNYQIPFYRDSDSTTLYDLGDGLFGYSVEFINDEDDYHWYDEVGYIVPTSEKSSEMYSAGSVSGCVQVNKNGIYYMGHDGSVYFRKTNIKR